MKQYHSAGVMLYRIKNENREYLLLQYAAGHWDFAKGKIEVGETKREAALRELAEEAGLAAKLDDTFLASFDYYYTDYDGQKAHKIVDFFLGEVQGSNGVVLSHEHIGYEWLPYEAAMKRLTFENAKNLIVKANEYLLLYQSPR
jgi:bis(5'-nucleosidyl)-tetraphosphatase